MFVDEIKIYARAGHGGKGCVAFHREKFIPKGGPIGGNGGYGGSVILEATHDLNNLINQYYQPRLIAKEGQGGLGKGMDGKAGSDLIIKVPCGTLVWRLAAERLPADMAPLSEEEQEAQLPASSKHRPLLRTMRHQRALEIDLSKAPEEETAAGSPGYLPSGLKSRGDLVVDLTQNGQRFVLCKGGRGGLGNRNFATAAHQAPRFAQPGEPGEEGSFLFELRILAEVGLVGYPNAGKSTLLTAISAARPKIAPYPFTTLTPQVGIMEYSDFKRLTVCDVPGLIEGAHLNVGLGHEFLRHIERCKVLALLVDMAGTDGRAPWDDYRSLLKELELYDDSLMTRPRLVVANKMDEPASAENLKQFKRKVRKVSILPMSAAFDQGLEEFKAAVRKVVEETSRA